MSPRTVDVVTTTLAQTTPPGPGAASPPDGVRIDRVTDPTPELVRWLYATVGGPWHWTDRLSWRRGRWEAELAEPGSEVHIAYADGAPAGYVQLGATVDGGETAVEIRYFGVMEWAIGRGIGGSLLSYAAARAWQVAAEHELPAVTRVWVHTCSLDGPHALANYQARGFEIVSTTTSAEQVAAEPLGSWVASGGPADASEPT